jgi:hypothetical protein
MNTESGSKSSWMLVVIVILTLIVMVGFFFLWLHPSGTSPVAAPSNSAAAGLQSVTPTGSAVSVPSFTVAPSISQQGTLEGAIAGRCGNIAWQKLDPKELAELKKLCPKQASAAAHGQPQAHP